ncbi:acetyl/propionyl-CoA carboxylase subunit alpha [Nitriliruptoraceae bacterium ZYF776]|nr:acetyl/propionyl-CoA carboxylase subunit alpha [Profundirhabdus halotolerans]
MFDRVLVANRGEIARRVFRTCRRLGIATVAVASDADLHEPHAREADRVVRLGPAPATSSYLDVARVVEAALETGADAVHPGYGFLAEHAGFAQAVRDAGLTFVGPSPDVIRLMGDKGAAKRHLVDAGVPVVPGVHAEGMDDAAVVAAADEVGFPLLVKAVAGGGGKGMRAVHAAADLPDALAAARREAASAFGDDRVLLERLVTRPRHVEVQVLGDRHGHVVHVLERECSVQRRHQKVVEECPSPALDQRFRDRMGAAAVEAAASVGYEGAGTVEFLVAGDTLDRDEPEFFFLEMNTRLQVEHPVTELVTSLDLVEQQLRVAAGEALGFTQDDVVIDGHAIEVRLYAEDPVAQLPQTGTITQLAVPDRPEVRADLGVEVGSEVTPHYDPMIGKLVVHASDRAAACDAMVALLADTTVHGVVTNLDLLHAIVDAPAFRTGDLTTAFLDDHLGGWAPPPAPRSALVAAAVATRGQAPPSSSRSPWDRIGPFRVGHVGGSVVRLADGDSEHVAHVSGTAPDLRVDLDGHVVEVDGAPHHARVTVDDATAWVHADGRTVRLGILPTTRHVDASALAGGAEATSPMPGSVIAVPVATGDTVTRGATLVVVEAMKMEHPVTAPADGTVTAVHVAVGDAVEAGTPLVAFEATPEEGAS